MSTNGYEQCITDQRSLVPIIIMGAGATIHYFLCLALAWSFGQGSDDNYGYDDDTENNKKVSCRCTFNPICCKIIKYFIAISFFICAMIQTILDYIQYSKLSSNIDNGSITWETYQCSIFLFTNSPNVLHAVAACFSICTAIILDRFDKSSKIPLFIFVAGEIFLGIVFTPFFASIFTHLIAGLFTYAWIAIPVFGASIFIFMKMNTASLEKTGKQSILFIGVFISMILMVLLIIVTNNTQIKLYDGIGYIESLKRTLIERKTVEYITGLETFDQFYSFIWLML